MGADRQLWGLACGRLQTSLPSYPEQGQFPHHEISAEPGMRTMGEVLYREDYGLAELCPSSLPAGPYLLPRRPHTLREETTSLLRQDAWAVGHSQFAQFGCQLIHS